MHDGTKDLNRIRDEQKALHTVFSSTAPPARTVESAENFWIFHEQSIRHDESLRRSPLYLSWELRCGIDSFEAEATSTGEVFHRWATHAAASVHAGELVAIEWYVRGQTFMERAPVPDTLRSYAGISELKTFTDRFTMPQNAFTGAPLRFGELPVVDLYWSRHGLDRFGFIQQVTGWKPYALQPCVPLSTLIDLDSYIENQPQRH